MLLTKIAVVDPRFRWSTVEDRVAQARAWAELLDGVALPDAERAVGAHYRESRDRIMPADVVARCPQRSVEAEADRELQAWLAARGLTRSQFEALSPSQVDALVRGDRHVEA